MITNEEKISVIFERLRKDKTNLLEMAEKLNSNTLDSETYDLLFKSWLDLRSIIAAFENEINLLTNNI